MNKADLKVALELIEEDKIEKCIEFVELCHLNKNISSDACIALSSCYLDRNPKESLIYAKLAYEVEEKKGAETSYTVLRQLALAYEANSMYEDACKIGAEAINQYQVDDFDLANNLSACYRDLGQFELSIEYGQLALNTPEITEKKSLQLYII